MTARQLETSKKPQLRRSDQSNESDGSDMDYLLEEALAGQIAVSAPLTRRETQILQSILAGRTNKQIARALCRSRRTIEYHRHRLMRKLNAHSAADLVRGAIAMGLAGQTNQVVSEMKRQANSVEQCTKHITGLKCC